MNCLEAIHLTVEDDVLLYWAEVSTNTKRLQEHAGNERVIIKKNGAYYYSNNDGPLKSFDQYFNTDLVLHRTLSAAELNDLKETLAALQLEQQPTKITNPDMGYVGGYLGYLHVQQDGHSYCKEIDMSAPVYEKIKALVSL